MSDCQSIECCETALYTYGLTGTLTPGPPIIVDPPGNVPIYRLMLSDNFNGENGGAPHGNWTQFLHWTVPGGASVDLIDNTTPGLGALVGYGLFVDMLGTSPPLINGRIYTDPFDFVPGTYRLRFDVSGLHHNGLDRNLRFIVGAMLDETITVIQGTLFTVVSRDFVVTVAQAGAITFSQVNGGAIDRGSLLDNITLEQIA